jgi:Putative amidase domain
MTHRARQTTVALAVGLAVSLGGLTVIHATTDSSAQTQALRPQLAVAVTDDPPVPPATDPPAPVANHTLTSGKCGKAKGRATWRVGSVQCHRMDSGGAVVAIARGKSAVKYSGTPVEREIKYVAANWYTQGATKYSYIPNEDCANFVSQALSARGWKSSPSWKRGSKDWISSTHLRKWILRTHPGVKELSGVASFSKVKVGDIAQFDWDNSGNRDHTAIVTSVQLMADGTYKVSVGEHTDPYEYRGVLHMITVVHPGAKVYFLSL